MISEIPIVKDDGAQLYFDENDIRQACGILVCGDHTEECIREMKAGSTECVLCYVVLKAQKKPFKVKRLGGARRKRT